MRALFVVTTAVACACFLEPGTGLRGQWGGRLIAIDARASDVRLTYAAPVVGEGRERDDDDARRCIGLAAPRRADGHDDYLRVLHPRARRRGGFQWLGLFGLSLRVLAPSRFGVL